MDQIIYCILRRRVGLFVCSSFFKTAQIFNQFRKTIAGGGRVGVDNNFVNGTKNFIVDDKEEAAEQIRDFS